MPKSDHIARAYAAPPAEFTATRNRLVAELRKTGRAADARALAQLRKPSAPLWAANRVASTEGKSLGALFDAVERVRETQLRDPRRAAEALAAQRAALETLVAHGRKTLAGVGLAASQQALRRLSDTLLGAAVDREHAEALRRGELTEELPAPGFEAFTGIRVPERPRLRLVRKPEPTPKPDPGRDREAVSARAEAQRRRAQEAEELTRRAAERAREVTELEVETATARARVADLQRKLRAARQTARQAAAAAKRTGRKGGSR